MCGQLNTSTPASLLAPALPVEKGASDASHSCERRGQERGVARPEVLQALLASTDRVVQEVDSVEYGLTDIQVSLCSWGMFCLSHDHPICLPHIPASICVP